MSDLISREDATRKKITMNPSNKRYYSEEYIRGWEDGVRDQYNETLSAEPQGELISKDDAIKAVANYIWHLPNECYKNFNSYNDIEEVVTDAVKQLPSAEAKTKCIAQIKVDTEEIVRRIKEEYDITDEWIPVSERLPKQTDEYIVSVHYSRDCVWTDKFGYTPTTDGGWYDPEDTKQNMVDWNKYIVAWMPLPKPYREENEE